MPTPTTTASPRERLALRLARWRFHARRLGWSGLAGVTVALMALAFHLTAVRGAQQQVAATLAQIEALRHPNAARQGVPQSAARSQLETLHRFFPGRDARAAALVRIYALAGEQGLSLESGDYLEILPDAAQKRAGESLARYQITLPLRGPYPALRSWLATVMNEMPAVALDDFSLKRDTVANPVVDARVRLTLYFEER